MNKLVAILMSVMLIVSLAGCGVSSPGSSGQGTISPSELFTDEPLTGEITVSAFDSIFAENFLLEAAALFEEMHPGTTVTIDTFSAMPEMRTGQATGGGQIAVMQIEDDPQARADYINRISAALMGGGGPDILAMDVLPIDRFARSGFLVDLSSYMDADPDFNRDDFRTNIFDAAELDGGLWFVPLDFSFEYYTFDSTLIPAGQASSFGPGSAFSLAELMEIAAPLHDGSALLFNQPEFAAFGGPGGRRGGMFRTLLGEDFSSFINLENRTAHFDDGRFVGLLNSIREYASHGYIPPAIGGTPDLDQIMRFSTQDQPTERVFYKSNSSGMLRMDFMRGLTENQMFMTGGGGMGTITDDDLIAGIAANTDGSIPFTFTQGYAINSNSPNQRLAWEFIKFLLSHEMQTSTNMLMVATPVRLSAVEPVAERFFSGGIFRGQQGAVGQPATMSDEARAAMNAYLEAADFMARQINTLNIRDSIVDDMITAEVSLFFDGSKTADEVASSLQSRVGLYLSE